MRPTHFLKPKTDFGPLMRTTDPDVFKAQINALSADGGGDFPEMSLSGLQVALTGAPPSSEIFLFTDAPAKDLNLMGTVIALIERTKSVVSFFLTGSLGLRRRRASDQGQGQVQHSRMVESDSQLYMELSQASGGQAIQVTKTELPKATSIIVESSSSSLVTLTPIVNIRVTLGPQCEGWDKRVLISHNSLHKCGTILNKVSALVQ
eukprot:XP_014044065.1 PREDICTED: von Willebrand factor A domain-containing protein 7-like isoform X2 [Salmo salar]